MRAGVKPTHKNPILFVMVKNLIFKMAECPESVHIFD
jgi:hypothetical protein